MAKFKPGPAKTRSGIDVVIFEVSDKIYGKVHKGAHSWDLGGKYYEQGEAYESIMDLVPNVEPFKLEATVYWTTVGKAVVPVFPREAYPYCLVGKKGTLTFVEDVE